MARPKTTEPDLVGELRKIQGRLEQLERRPTPQTVFDQYPVAEWATVPRPMITATGQVNRWKSASVANVTGMKYDRVEIKYLSDYVVAGRSEAELRLAAFRHDRNSAGKQCITASATLRLKGNSTTSNQFVCIGKFRWIHGIQFGWEYADAGDDAIYTIELQTRYPDDQHQTATQPVFNQIFGFGKTSNDADPYAKGLLQGDGANGYWAPGVRPVNNAVPASGWMNIPPYNKPWDGAYEISSMHYCVGMPQERLPDATTQGWHWYSNSNTEWVRPANINEPYQIF